MGHPHHEPHFCAQGHRRTGSRRDPPSPALYTKFWFDMAQPAGVPSRRRRLEPCPPLVRLFDYRLTGKNHDHRTPSYDSSHRAWSFHRRVCGPVAEKIFSRRGECIPSGADGHHSLRCFNRQLHGQSPVCPGPPRCDGDGDVQSGADVVGASDCSAYAIYGRECSHPEHDQSWDHFRSGSERNRDCSVRFARSVMSERRHLFRGGIMPWVGATRTHAARCGRDTHDRRFRVARFSARSALRRHQTTHHPAADLDCGVLWIRRQCALNVVSGLCEKAVRSRAGRSRLPMVVSGNRIAPHVGRAAVVHGTDVSPTESISSFWRVR